MELSVHWIRLAVLSCLLLGGEVRCDCTEENMQIEGGNYTLTKELNRGSLLIYNCPENYYPYPALSRLCQLDDTWNPLPKRFKPQRCKMVECPDPTVLEYGSVYPPQEKYFVNNETTYECYDSYTLRGSSKRVCLPNGKWNGITPVCSRGSTAANSCPNPGIPPGGSRSGNTFEIDDRVRYSCQGNLFLVGPNERVCLENGQWTGIEPACYYKHTYDTELEVSQSFGSAIKDSLTTMQPLDDTQEGRIIRISKSGTLNIYIAMDVSESIEEEHLKSAKDAVSKLITKISSFPVSPNYDVMFFSSTIIKVASILDYIDGKVSLNDVKTNVENFKVGDRNTEGTDLNLVFSTYLERMAIIKQNIGDEAFKEHRHVIILFTDGAYNMGGSPAPTVAKIKNMVSMNLQGAAAKEREEYLDIYIFAIGAEILDDDLQPLTTGTGGLHYFRMKEIKNLHDSFDDIINEDDVMGLCGMHKAYRRTNNKDIKKKMYPWLAFIIVTNNGLTRQCLGSLVTPKFILTAAHCFVFGDLPEHVRVEIDDGGSVEKTVKNFTLHPDYNIHGREDRGVKEFYDYDVALVQLEEAVTISVGTRPICIPCTQETSEALKLVGVSTCKQQEDILLKDQLERLTFLTKSGVLAEEKDVHAKLGDNRDTCIQHALQAKGITTDNVRDAVTDNFLCTGGLTPFRDHIACTGDSGGAVFKDYELRTIQIAVVSWGTKNLCTHGGRVDSVKDSRDFHVNLFRVVPFLKSILGDDRQDDYAPLKFLEN